MQAMDAEFERMRPQKQAAGADKGKGKAKASREDPEQDGDIDIEAAMQEELKAALEGGLDETDVAEALGSEGMDYNLIKNFLESFKSQAGLAGPVGNLAGRLQPGWTIPRDDS